MDQSDNGQWQTFSKRKRTDSTNSNSNSSSSPANTPARQVSFRFDHDKYVLKTNSIAIKMDWIRNFIMWVFNAGSNSGWITFQNKNALKKVAILAVNGLNYHLIEKYSHHLPNLSKFVKFPMMAPGSKVNLYSSTQTLLVDEKPGKADSQEAKRQKIEAHPFMQSFDLSKVETLPEYLLMSDSQLSVNDYPIESDCPPYLRTDVGFSGVDQDGKILHELLAMDCEMCTTKNGLELTRISIVDHKLQTILDEFAVPVDPIINYNTKYSGITKETLEGVTNRLEHIQEKLKAIISKDTILVGHSLENDLKALKIVHKKVIDTALLFPRPGGKHSLKFLTKKFLKEDIQIGTHDSIQDSVSAMKLVHLKLIKEKNSVEDEENHLSMFEILHRQGKKSAMFERIPQLIDRYNSDSTSASLCATDSEVAEKMASGSKGDLALVWGHLQDLAAFYSQHPAHFLIDQREVESELSRFVEKTRTEDLGETVGGLASGEVQIEKELIEVLKKIDLQAKTVYDGLPLNTFFIVLSSHEALYKNNFQTQLIKSGYKSNEPAQKTEDLDDATITEFMGLTPEEETLFANVISTKRHSVCYMSVKN
eukprot:TRINITY_DN4992_c0_g1_i1.p1 TRINITY_DN4992_c0_g1~~TRINITY_DN4992_c0_g1_i1.p1  ORF type:complete len:600 (-),score=270.22 TRINITY_DN4992_c0_g1_i1:13-1791(-)